MKFVSLFPGTVFFLGSMKWINLAYYDVVSSIWLWGDIRSCSGRLSRFLHYSCSRWMRRNRCRLFPIFVGSGLTFAFVNFRRKWGRANLYFRYFPWSAKIVFLCRGQTSSDNVVNCIPCPLRCARNVLVVILWRLEMRLSRQLYLLLSCGVLKCV